MHGDLNKMKAITHNNAKLYSSEAEWARVDGVLVERRVSVVYAVLRAMVLALYFGEAE